jgi:CRISPR type IV-associated protein Csf1
MDNQVRVGDFTGIIMSDPEMVDIKDEYCWLCGGSTGGLGLPVKKAIKDTFTDRDKARQPASNSICPGCAFCLSFMSLRNYSILATENKLRHSARAEMRDILLEPPEPPFVLCIAVSGQKWLHFRAQVAYSCDGFPVQYEETPIFVDRPVLAMLLELIEQLYAVFTKSEILSGQCGQNRIRQFGLAEFQRIENKLAPHRGSRLFDLAVFVAQKPPEEE